MRRISTHQRVRSRAMATARGLTLIELLVVVAIIALLISILLPALAKAKEHTKSGVCQSNLRQLVMAITYYAEDNENRLPYILGSIGPSGKPNVAPYYQYHQMFDLWRYVKDLKIYRCPSARDTNSVKWYDTADGMGNPRRSYYTIFKSDDKYMKAYQEGWWPDVNQMDWPDGETIPPLYTEYWFNDYSEGATFTTNGQPIPAFSGGLINKIPLPHLATIISDARWEAPTAELRHAKGTQFGFVDGHVEGHPRLRYYDDRRQLPSNEKKDYDIFGNRPFWGWGLSREGYDFDP